MNFLTFLTRFIFQQDLAFRFSISEQVVSNKLEFYKSASQRAMRAKERAMRVMRAMRAVRVM